MDGTDYEDSGNREIRAIHCQISARPISAALKCSPQLRHKTVAIDLNRITALAKT